MTMLSCLETLLHCMYLVTWTPDLTDKASRHQTSATAHLTGRGREDREGGQPIYKSWGQTCVSIAAVVVRVHAPHLSHEETIRHLPPKHLHKISLPQLKLKLWVGTRGTLLRIVVIQGNKLRVGEEEGDLRVCLPH